MPQVLLPLAFKYFKKQQLLLQPKPITANTLVEVLDKEVGGSVLGIKGTGVIGAFATWVYGYKCPLYNSRPLTFIPHYPPFIYI